MSRIVPSGGFQGHIVCAISVGDEAGQVPHAEIGVEPTADNRYEIVIMACRQTHRLFAACYAHIRTGRPCELQQGELESHVCLGVLDDLTALCGHIDEQILRLREHHARNPFDLLGCVIDEQLATLLAPAPALVG